MGIDGAVPGSARGGDRQQLDRTRAEGVVMGRRNWLHVRGEVGGERAANLFSLTISCHRLKLEPFAYLYDIVPRLSSHPQRAIWELTPRGWRDRRAQAATKVAKLTSTG
jgi:hypothetical protein